NLLRPVLLAGFHALDPHGEPARAAPGERGSMGKPRLVEDPDDARAEVLGGGADHPRGDLLASDLEEERLRHRACSAAAGRSGTPVASRFARWACAQRTARRRIRWMSAARSVTLTAPRASSTLKRCEHFSAAS